MPTPTPPPSRPDLLAAFVDALRDEAEAQRRSGGRPIDVRDGRRVDTSAEGAAYRFALHADVFLPDGAPVRLSVDGRHYDAEVVQRQGDAVLLFIDWPPDAEPPPETIEEATLRAEPWFLTAALADRLEALELEGLGVARELLARFAGGLAGRFAAGHGSGTDEVVDDEPVGRPARKTGRAEEHRPSGEARSPDEDELTGEPGPTWEAERPDETRPDGEARPSGEARPAGEHRTADETQPTDEHGPNTTHPLDPSQAAAVEACCRDTIHFVWGPPGTGKTRTLGALVARLAARGETVLVLAHANVAVDAACLAAATALGLDRPEVLRGATPQPTLVRAGPPALPAVRALGITAEDVALRRRPDLARRIRALTAQLARLEEGAEATGGLGRSGTAGAFGRASPWDGGAGSLALRDGSPGRAAERARPHPDAGPTRPAGRSAEIHRELKALRAELREEERAAVASAQVLFATLPKAAVDEMIHRRRFDAALVDEASMALPPQVLFAASRARRRLALFGDFRQLPPIVTATTPTTRALLERDAFDLAGIPAALDAGTDPVDLSMLRIQYRMHPAIRRLVSTFAYLGRLHDGPAVAAETEPIAARAPAPGEPVALLLTEPLGARSWLEARRTSRWSPMSGLWAARFAHDLAADHLDVALLSPYRPQTAFLAALVRALGVRDSVTTGTIHRFQGAERAAVVLDLADGPPLHPPGQLLRGPTGARLLTVAASRARGKLVVLASRVLLEAPGPAADLLGELPPLPRPTEPWTLAAGGTTVEWFPDVRAALDELARDAAAALAAWLPADLPPSIRRVVDRPGAHGARRGSAIVLADEVVWILGDRSGWSFTETAGWAAARIVGRGVVRAVWLNLVGSRFPGR